MRDYLMLVADDDDGRYAVVGYTGVNQTPVFCHTLGQARVQRNLRTGRIIDMLTGDEVK